MTLNAMLYHRKSCRSFTNVPETAGEKEKMNRTKLQTYIEETYGAIGECLWAKYPTYMVFRHNSNRKWFAAIMEIPKEKL